MLRVCPSLHAVTPPFAARETLYRTGLGRRPRQSRSEAFTLIELMVVVAILTLLVTVALPAYQQARSTALVSSLVSELLGYSRVCAQINSTGIGTRPAPPPVTLERGGVQITQGCTAENQGATLEASWGTARASGIACSASRSLITSSKATVTIASQGELSCSFQD